MVWECRWRWPSWFRCFGTHCAIVCRETAVEAEGVASERDDAQAGNAVKVADVRGADRIAQLQRASSDDEIGQRKSDPFGGFPGADPPDNFCGRFGDRMNRNMRFQL